MIEGAALSDDYDVQRLKSRGLDVDYRNRPPTTYRCERCPYTTTQITAGLVHAWTSHNDPARQPDA